jgi:cytochrome c-type biogenesis protein CcmH/NrfG
MKTVVLDTNVLLADPNVLLSYPRAEVVIPETVLGELDKLKTARVDSDLRFRGREISRILFDLSEEGSLIEGVDLPDGGRLRVAPFENDSGSLPEGMNTRNSDDRILATVYQLIHAEGAETDVTLVTNDLNMLLKAQTLGIGVERHDGGSEGSFARRYIIKPFQRYRVPIGILAVAVAVFVAVILVAVYSQRSAGAGALPAEFKGLLTTQQITALDALTTLQNNPDDPDSLLKMGNFYYDAHNAIMQTDPVAALNYGRQGLRYYERYLAVAPSDNDARADFASLLFYTGQTDRAIQEVSTVLQKDKNHVNANFNLGMFYGQGRRDYPAAIAQMEKVIALTQNDQNQHGVYQSALTVLEQLKQAQKSAGQSIAPTGGVQQ